MGAMQTVASLLWRRLDTPGHDACRLDRNDVAWQIDGAAVFRHGDGRIAHLHYRVRCDRHWHTLWGTVRGWLGDATVDLSVVHGRAGWTLNDRPVPDLSHCVDLDLGFSPASNLLQLRRLHLAEGESADVPVAWLDIGDASLSLLEQRYECAGPQRYAYTAPRFDYSAELQADAHGFVHDYPGLWVAEAARFAG